MAGTEWRVKVRFGQQWLGKAGKASSGMTR